MNYLVYNNRLPIENLIELDVQSGEIFTALLFFKMYPIKIHDDKILRGDGGVPAVVHQYDRQKKLVGLVDKFYRDKNFHADEKFSDARSILEQVNHLAFLGKIDAASRLGMNNLPANANFGGNVDLLLKIWERVLNCPLTPAVGYLELSAQNALLSAKNFSFAQLNKICSCLIGSVKNQRIVLPKLKLAIVDMLFNLIEQTITAKASAQCFRFIDMAETIEPSPNKNFRLLQAKANRIFGRKTEALAAYKAALELD